MSRPIKLPTRWPKYPPVEEIQEKWLTADQMAKMKNISREAVAYACKKKNVWAIKFGEWRIEPESAKQYIPRKKNKRKSIS